MLIYILSNYELNEDEFGFCIHEFYVEKALSVSSKLREVNNSLIDNYYPFDSLPLEILTREIHPKQFGFSSKEEMEKHDKALGWTKKTANQVQDKKQVDFDLLKDSFDSASLFFEKHMYHKPKMKENFDLFVKMMKKSSRFAHKAHKEIRKR